MPTTFIYALIDPDTGKIRYIGKSTNPQRRLIKHISDARKGATNYRCSWVRGVLQRGHEPRLLVLQKCDGDGCAEECFHISLARWNGMRLVNATDGGDGLVGWKPSDATRAKMSVSSKKHNALRRGVPRTPEVIAKIKATRAANRDNHKQRDPDERLRSLNTARANRTFGPEMRAHQSAAAKARCARDPNVMRERGLKNIGKAIAAAQAPEAKAKRLASRKGYRYPPEVRAKIAASLTGRKLSPERCEKHRQAMLKTWARRKSATNAAAGSNGQPALFS